MEGRCHTAVWKVLTARALPSGSWGSVFLPRPQARSRAQSRGHRSIHTSHPAHRRIMRDLLWCEDASLVHTQEGYDPIDA